MPIDPYEMDERIRTIRKLAPKKHWYHDGSTIYFDHVGVDIAYPMWDETGRERVDPDYYDLDDVTVATLALWQGEEP